MSTHGNGSRAVAGIAGGMLGMLVMVPWWIIRAAFLVIVAILHVLGVIALLAVDTFRPSLAMPGGALAFLARVR